MAVGSSINLRRLLLTWLHHSPQHSRHAAPQVVQVGAQPRHRHTRRRAAAAGWRGGGSRGDGVGHAWRGGRGGHSGVHGCCCHPHSLTHELACFSQQAGPAAGCCAALRARLGGQTPAVGGLLEWRPSGTSSSMADSISIKAGRQAIALALTAPQSAACKDLHQSCMTASSLMPFPGPSEAILSMPRIDTKQGATLARLRRPNHPARTKTPRHRPTVATFPHQQELSLPKTTGAGCPPKLTIHRQCNGLGRALRRADLHHSRTSAQTSDQLDAPAPY